MPRTVDHEFWQEFLTERPDVMHRLLAELYHAASAVKGRRRTESAASVDDLWKLVTPQFSNEPFGPALKEALGKRSVRWLAAQLKVHHYQVARLINGEREIVSLRDPAGSMYQIEGIARALRIHPSYFVEWRRLWILSLVDDAFTAQPNLSIGVYKRFAGHEAAAKPPTNGR